MFTSLVYFDLSIRSTAIRVSYRALGVYSQVPQKKTVGNGCLLTPT